MSARFATLLPNNLDETVRIGARLSNVIGVISRGNSRLLIEAHFSMNIRDVDYNWHLSCLYSSSKQNSNVTLRSSVEPAIACRPISSDG